MRNMKHTDFVLQVVALWAVAESHAYLPACGCSSPRTVMPGILADKKTAIVVRRWPLVCRGYGLL